MSSFARYLLIAASASLFVVSGTSAQLLPGVQVPQVGVPVTRTIGTVGDGLPVAGPALRQLIGSPDGQRAIDRTLDSVAGLSDRVASSGAVTLMELRRLRLRELIREHRRELEADDDGHPIRRGTLVAINPAPSDLREAARAGFRTIGGESNPELGFTTVHLAVPTGMSARDGLKRLRNIAPRIEADFDHVFEPAGGALAPVAGAVAVSSASGGVRIGIIDGGVASHPSLARASIEQHGFSGNPHPTGHGTAVASLIAGQQGPFRGAAPGASLFVADIYGGNRAAGSASAVVRALGWLASKRPRVINISLVGPRNRVVARAIQQVRARGIHIVAAVGNDGPAAPPQYPASYPGVVAVTGVDSRGRALIEAGKAAHLDFAAPGADMAAAVPGRGYARVRGTSFAAPFVAARLSLAGSVERLGAEARPGRGRVGKGIVCGTCRIDPKAVRAK